MNTIQSQSSPLQLMEQVVTGIKVRTSLSNRIKSLEPSLIQLSEKWYLTPISALLLTIIFDRTIRKNHVDIEALVQTLDSDVFEVLRVFTPSIRELLNKGLLTQKSGFRDIVSYRIPSSILQRIIENKSIRKVEPRELSNLNFYRILSYHFRHNDFNDASLRSLYYATMNLCENNKQLPVPKFISESNLNPTETLFLLFGLNEVFSDNEEVFTIRHFINKFESNSIENLIFDSDSESEVVKFDFDTLRTNLKDGSSKLLTQGILKSAVSEFTRTHAYSFSSKAINDFFIGIDLW